MEPLQEAADLTWAVPKPSGSNLTSIAESHSPGCTLWTLWAPLSSITSAHQKPVLCRKSFPITLCPSRRERILILQISAKRSLSQKVSLWPPDQLRLKYMLWTHQNFFFIALLMIMIKSLVLWFIWQPVSLARFTPWSQGSRLSCSLWSIQGPAKTLTHYRCSVNTHKWMRVTMQWKLVTLCDTCPQRMFIINTKTLVSAWQCPSSAQECSIGS